MICDATDAGSGKAAHATVSELQGIGFRCGADGWKIPTPWFGFRLNVVS
jgi:hypothetical protein